MYFVQEPPNPGYRPAVSSSGERTRSPCSAPPTTMVRLWAQVTSRYTEVGVRCLSGHAHYLCGRVMFPSTHPTTITDPLFKITVALRRCLPNQDEKLMTRRWTIKKKTWEPIRQAKPRWMKHEGVTLVWRSGYLIRLGTHHIHNLIV
jgi:hypothetical protein